jgi:hypothetical protein
MSSSGRTPTNVLSGTAETIIPARSGQRYGSSVAKPRSIPDVKVCSVCKIEKPSDEFTRQYVTRNGEVFGPYSRAACKKCLAAGHRARYAASGVKRAPATSEVMRSRNLKAAYGITDEDYEEMLASQNGCCAICLVNVTDLSRKLVIDHCHKSGKIRALLCATCNSALGFAKDSSEILRRAADYLDSHLAP